MYDIKTPIEKLHRRVLTLVPGVNTTTSPLLEGQFVEPSAAAGEEGMWKPVGATIPALCYPNITNTSRPDVRAANLNGSGTITVAAGPHVAITDEFERTVANFPAGITAYAVGMPLTVKNKVLLPAAAGETVQAIVEVAPENLTAGSIMWINRLY